jgi:hypothetical protein
VHRRTKPQGNTKSFFGHHRHCPQVSFSLALLGLRRQDSLTLPVRKKYYNIIFGVYLPAFCSFGPLQLPSLFFRTWKYLICTRDVQEREKEYPFPRVKGGDRKKVKRDKKGKPDSSRYTQLLCLPSSPKKIGKF